MMRHWIKAARLRTLPLALAGIIAGSFLFYRDNFDLLLFALTLLTATLLQILSNFANDLGDYLKGTDKANREGEQRMVASGMISPKHMKRAVWICAAMALISGVILLRMGHLAFKDSLLLLAIGLLALLAAVAYTLGKNAYGYLGFGDLSVFIFFGLIAVGGSSALQLGELEPASLLPGSSIGLLAVAVLNLNNLRDWENDKQHNKKTLVVRMGFVQAKKYHLFLLLLPFVLCSYYTIVVPYFSFRPLFWLSAPWFLFLARKVWLCTEAKLLDGELKKQALGTLFFAILLAIGAVL